MKTVNTYLAARDIILPAIMQAYEEEALTKVEFDVVRGAVLDVFQDLIDDQAVESVA